MFTANELVRAELFYKVLNYRLDHPEATIAESCAMVGVNERTFYRWVTSDGEAMRVVKDALNDAQKAALFEYSQRMYTALKLLLDDAVNPKLKTETRLRVLKFVFPLFDELAKVHHAEPGGEDQAPFLKRGPTLEHAQSRLATLDIRVDEHGVKVEVLKDDPIIDGTLQEPQGSPET